MTPPILPPRDESGDPADPSSELDSLLAELARRGARLRLEGDRLRLKAPRDAVTPALREALERHKDRIVARLSAGESGGQTSGTGAAGAIPPAPRDRPIPLSWSQQGLWFLDRLEGPSATYVIPACAWIEGAVDAARLERAFTALAMRHEILRTTFPEAGGLPIQEIHPAPLCALEQADLAGERDPEAACRAIAERFVAEPFDLAAGPLWRARLVRLSPSRHALLVALHHAIADAWSMGIFYAELARLYDDEAAGAPLPRLPIQYADFTAWHRAWLDEGRLGAGLAYWRRRLDGAPALHDLPADRPRPPVQSFRGAVLATRLDEDLARSLRSLASSERTTLFTVLLAAFQLFLHRMSGRGTTVVGCPAANRPVAETEALIGYFVNTVVLRADHRPGTAFREYLEAQKRETLQDFACAHIPFEALVAELKPERTLGATPLFQVLFALQNAPVGARAGRAIAFTPFKVDRGRALYDLYLSCEDEGEAGGGGILCEWEYATDLFEEATVRRYAAHFETMLRALAADPDLAIERIPLLDARDLGLIVDEWNRTEAPWPSGSSLVDLLDAGFAHHAGRIALVDGDRTFRFSDLDRDSARIADRLRAAIAGSSRPGREGRDAPADTARSSGEVERLVGVMGGRTAELIIAILGILRAGHAYVPLDPAYPAARIRFMVEDAALAALVADDEDAVRSAGIDPDRVPVIHPAAVLASPPSSPAPLPPVARPGPGSLAYVIYTSGSTGRPKGIQIEHRNAVAFLDWAAGVFGPEDRAGILASTSICFDLSIFEILLPLTAGGTIILAENALALPDLPARERVTLLNTVPSAARELLRLGAIPASVRVVNLAGEPLDADLADRLYALGTIRDVHDLYGPGEDTTYSTWARREPGGPEIIGRPIANTRAYVLDETLAPVPIGVTGEIWLSGAGVTRGYLGRPELTAERYRQFGVAGRPVERLYRTGDLGRWRPDGNLQYLGRIDHQVKIRGFRIELGEVESALRAAGASEAVVHAFPGEGGGSARLAGYYVGSIEVEELRSRLRAALPEFMVPPHLVRLPRLPLTPNGKVDRKALPAPGGSDPAGERLREPGIDPARVPRGPVEELVAAAWRDLLGLAHVDREDNFFAIGGDSILGMQVVARMRRAGWRVSPRLIFRHQTVAALAAAAERDAAADMGPAAAAERAAGDPPGTRLPLPPAAHWLLQAAGSMPRRFHQVLSFDLARSLDPATLERALARLVEAHAALRLRLALGGEAREAIVREPYVPEIVPANAAGDAETAWAAALDRAADRAIDPADGRLIAAVLGSGFAGGDRLALLAHHVAVDGVSWRILIEDLVRILDAGEDPAVGEAYGAAIRAAAEDAVPPDPGHPAAKRGRHRDLVEERLVLDADLTRRLLQDANEAYRSRPEELILAAVAPPWSRLVEPGERDLILDIEGHGRDRVDLDLSRVVGWFTRITALAIPGDPGSSSSDDAALASWIRVVKESVRSAASRTGRDARKRPALAFNYLGRLDRIAPPDSGFVLGDADLLVDPDLPLTHAVEIGALVREGRLELRFRYDGTSIGTEAARAAARESCDRLASVVRHCLDPRNGGLSPSDLPGLGLDQQAIDRWLPSLPGLGPRDLEDVVALTPTQEGILFHALESGDPGMYVTQVSFTLLGELDPERFREAWSRVVERHEALRTLVVRLPSGQAVRAIARRAVLPWAVEDWSREESWSRERRLRLFLADDRARGVPVDRAPGMRLHLARLGPTAHRFTWTSHHLFLDGWSLAIVLRDVVRSYASPESPARIRLPGPDGLPGSTRRHRDWLDAIETTGAIAFWRAELAEMDPPADLLLPSPAPGGDAVAPAVHEFSWELDEALTGRVKAFARRRALTLHSVLQGAWALLLARLARRADVVFGVTVAGRPPEIEGIEEAAGLFIQTLPARIIVEESQPIGTWLAGLQEAQARREEHGHVALADLRAVAGLPGGTPLFDVLFVLENYPVDETLVDRAGAFGVEGLEVLERTNYPLTGVVSDGTRLSIRVQASAQRYAREVPRDLALRFARILDALCSSVDPSAPVSSVTWSLPGEADHVRAWSQGPSRDYPGAPTLIGLVEEQVARTPDAVAVTAGAASWTYRELDERANALAHRLLAEGVREGDRVAVLVERSLELEQALWGVLKAGAAWVPIDPADPRERIASLLADADVRAVVTLARHAGVVDPALATATTSPRAGIAMLLADDPAHRDARAPSPPPRTIGPGAIAYMIYTSGSTGAPKGALNSHGAIRNRLLWMQEEFRLEPGEAVLQKTPATFDVSVWEFFWPLLVGARLVFAPPGLHRDAAGLAALIDRERVSTVHFVPSMLDLFLELSPADSCKSLRRVIASGEALSGDLRDRFHRRFAGEGACVLSNLYGPTEAAVDVSCHHCRPGERGPVPIGRPIANTSLHIVDRELRPLPPGVAGEILIGGVAVGAGYHARETLTREVFLPDPWSAEPGARLYRTGDLGRWTPGGEIEYLGRIDRQVKVRGVRVEPGEIEAAARSCSGVREAVADVRRDASGQDVLVLYAVPAPGTGGPGLVRAIRDHLARALAESMRPAHVVVLDALPRLASGKIDRRALGDPGDPAGSGLAAMEGARGGDRESAAWSSWERRIAGIWADVLGREGIDPSRNFFDQGGTSIHMMRIHARLAAEVPGSPAITEFFRRPTVRAMARWLAGEPEHADSRSARRPGGESGTGCDGIAVVGMACRLPGAESPDEFWSNLVAGVESIRRFSREELLAAGVSPQLADDPSYVPAHGAMERDPSWFDAGLFGYSPREAALLDPQQRIFLELCHELLERAGYVPGEVNVPVGVFAGASLNLYLLRNLASRPEVAADAGEFAVLIGNDKDFLPTRVAYKLDLRGPAVNIQSACSTSLVAIVNACESLARRECAMAIAGGVSVRIPQAGGYLHEPGLIFSPDGHCRPFDVAGAGIVSGSGAGVVLLKRLEEARADGDHIHAVIRGWAMNNDGAAKVGFTAPGVDGQAGVIAAAWDKAGVDRSSLGYLEAHGTATPLGDPIEVTALNAVFGGAAPAGSRLIGSVKSNLGHLDAAAGIAGFLKAALAVEHGLVPPSLHFQSPNPAVPFAEGPFRVADRLSPWPIEGPRRAGVSSFGIGGTNAHVVLEAAPSVDVAEVSDLADPTSAGLFRGGRGGPGAGEPRLAVVSARTAEGLATLSDEMASRIESAEDRDLACILTTLAHGRRRHSWRRVAVGTSAADLARALRVPDGVTGWEAEEEALERPVVFLFPGQGAPYHGMASGLFAAEPVFRTAIEEARAIVHDAIGWDLLTVICPDKGSDAPAPDALENQLYLHASLVAVECALARLWRSRGVEPSAVAGHSLGEYAAAVVAGVFSLEEALRLAMRRGELLESLPPGALLAVPLSAEELAPRLDGSLALAVINAPSLCLVSGPLDELARFSDRLRADGIEARGTRVNRAVHSRMTEPLIPALAVAAAEIRSAAPVLPFLSNRTAGWMPDGAPVPPTYWAEHLRAPVRFSEGLACLLASSPSGPWRRPPLIVEVGPGRTLASAVLRNPVAAGVPVLTTVRHVDERACDHAFFLAALGRAWIAGASCDPAPAGAEERRRRVPLPVGPFKPERHWIEPGDGTTRSAAATGALVWEPSWRREPVRAAPSEPFPRRWIVLESPGRGDASFASMIERRGGIARTIEPVSAFEAADPGRLRLDPANPDHWEQLGRMMASVDERPDAVVLATFLEPSPIPRAIEDVIAQGLDPLVGLARAFGADPRERRMRILVPVTGLAEVLGSDAVDPALALLVGPVRVIPQEYRDLSTLLLDVPSRDGCLVLDSERVLDELIAPATRGIVALRDERRWAESFEPVSLGAGALEGDAPPWPSGGVALVTGGTRGVGLELAEAVAARDPSVRLVLVSRSGVGAEDADRVRALGARCGGVRVHAADVADRDALASVRAAIESDWGEVALVVHAAGVPGRGLIQSRDRERTREELRAKVEGTRILEDVFGSAARLIVACSSTNGSLGGVGQVGYTAANAYLDAWARTAGPRGLRKLSIAWHRWSGVGMSVEADRILASLGGASNDGTRRAPGDPASPSSPGIAAAEARRLFPRLLEPSRGAVLAVCPCDLEALLRESRRFQAEEAWPSAQGPAPGNPSDPARPSVYADSTAGEWERRVAAAWADALGVPSIGVADTFAGLGGDSLLAVKVASRLRRELGVTVTVRMLYEAPTVKLLAGVLEALRWASGEEDPEVDPGRGSPGVAEVGEKETGLL